MEKMDYSCSSVGKIPGGEYGKVSVSGAAKAIGGLRCEALSVSGSLKVEGGIDCAGKAHVSGALKTSEKLAAGSLHISGVVTTGDEMECLDSLQISGVLNGEGDVSCKEGRVSGVCNLQSLHGESVTVTGILNADGDVEAENYVTTGRQVIKGLLNAEHIRINLTHLGFGASSCGNHIGSIGCCELTVLRGNVSDIEIDGHRIVIGNTAGETEDGVTVLFNRKVDGKYDRLEVGTIEGDDITLENTDAEVVRGRRVRIGAGCRIGSIEYAETLEVAEDSKVGAQTKV